ncbi:MAG: RnfABCDGE type electron transport complex subunit D [Clostridia bacterium]|nr:RnfABCDGE type electron transport complex subunit D [Clostridia bacterium]
MADNALIQKIKPTVAASPHFKSHETSQGMMLDVIIALVPALVASVWIFGPRALAVNAVSVVSCVLFEYITRKLLKRDNTIKDLSAVVTGLLLAFNLPSTLPLWMIPIGAFVAIVVVKQFFGGIGQNFVNPALMGRIVLMVSFAGPMSKWVEPYKWGETVDAVTTATPLFEIQNGTTPTPDLLDMLIGQRAGCLGETCAIALIIGGLYLLIRKVISPSIPLTFIGTVAVFMLIAGKGDPNYLAYNLLGGGLLIGAIFMATDYATCPLTSKGKIIYGIGCGLVAALIRQFGSYNEGVSFAIILMNLLVPHIDNLTKLKPFGYIKEKKQKEAKAE